MLSHCFGDPTAVGLGPSPRELPSYWSPSHQCPHAQAFLRSSTLIRTHLWVKILKDFPLPVNPTSLVWLTRPLIAYLFPPQPHLWSHPSPILPIPDTHSFSLDCKYPSFTSEPLHLLFPLPSCCSSLFCLVNFYFPIRIQQLGHFVFKPQTSHSLLRVLTTLWSSLFPAKNCE